jgi:hypothetical protein
LDGAVADAPPAKATAAKAAKAASVRIARYMIGAV